MDIINKITEHAIKSEDKRMGYHAILDLYSCQCDPLFYQELYPYGINLIDTLIKSSELTIIDRSVFQFDEGRSYTATVTLFESHIAIHTWSQRKFISADIFTCSKTFPTITIDILTNFFEPKYIDINCLNRGQRIFSDKSEPDLKIKV